jgi:hypothetical protein
MSANSAEQTGTAGGTQRGIGAQRGTGAKRGVEAPENLRSVASGGLGRSGEAPRTRAARAWEWMVWTLPAWLVAAVLGLAYVLTAPLSTDLSAAAYRSHLFSQAGFTLWDNGWYGGHHLPAYSILAPALGAWLGPQLLVALALVAATALFERLVDGLFPTPATRIAALWLALGAGIGMLANRVPFDLGLAVGMGSLLAARCERPVVALVLSVLCSLASPVAGAFLALAYLAWALARVTVPARPVGWRSAPGAWPFGLTLSALLPIGALSVAFPEGGVQPFVASAFYPALLGVLVVVALIPATRGAGARDRSVRESSREQRYAAHRRVLRIGGVLYGLVLIGAYVLPSAVGGNADRLGALMAGPLAACALVCSRPRWVILVLAPFLLYWQANAPVADFLAGASDPAVEGSYYTPLLAELQALGVGYAATPARIEVVPTRDHFEARYVAPAVAIARGWERQLDQGRNALFYEQGTPLTAARYRRWLQQQAISYVALPDAPLDYSGKEEGKLLARRTPSYLREVWRSPHWRLFAVLGARPLAQAPARIARMGSDSFTLEVARAGSYLVRVRFTPYWKIVNGTGCVREAPGGWTEVRASRPGALAVGIGFSLARVFQHGVRCS